MKPLSKRTKAELLDDLAALPKGHLVQLMRQVDRLEGPGPIEAAVLGRLEALTDPNPVLAAQAVQIASQLDSGMGMATAGVSKELREIVAELDPPTGDENDDARGAFFDRLSSPLGDPAKN